jgi:hypothetical protein
VAHILGGAPARRVVGSVSVDVAIMGDYTSSC